MESAVDRQNNILEGLAEIVKEAFSYIKEKDGIFKEKQLSDNTLARVINKQNVLIETQNKCLNKQQECLDTMCEVLKQVTVMHDMMADSEYTHIIVNILHSDYKRSNIKSILLRIHQSI